MSLISIPRGGYGQRPRAYSNPNLDENGLPFRLDRVSIAPSMFDADTVTGEISPTSTVVRPVLAESTNKALADERKEVEDDVSGEVADAVAAGEEAELEEGTEEEAEEEPAKPAIPSPITRDMYVRLVQFSDKDKVPDQEFKDGLNRISFYRRRVANRWFLERAKQQVEQDHTFTEDVHRDCSQDILP